MAKDPEVAACINCSRRPTDPDTGTQVEGSLLAATRETKFGRACILYSPGDPRISQAFLYGRGAGSSTVVREATRCARNDLGIMAADVGPDRGSFDRQLATMMAERDTTGCALNGILNRSPDLPDNMLMQQPQREESA
jgi:hypothetical protein